MHHLPHRSMVVLTHAPQCDGLKPACQRCTKSGKTCTGFPSTFKFLCNETPGRDRIPSPKRRPSTNPTSQTMISTRNKKSCLSTETWRSTKTHESTGVSLVNSQSSPSPRNSSAQNRGIQYPDMPAIQENASLRLIENPPKSPAEVPLPTSEFGSLGNTEFTSFSSTTKSTYSCHYPEATHGRTSSSMQEWPTRSSPETPSLDSCGASLIFTANEIVTTKEMPLPCTPNLQLSSSAAFLADQELEAYWEKLTSDYVASCQTNYDSNANSSSMLGDVICVGDTKKGLVRLQLEERALDTDPHLESVYCGDRTLATLSQSELYLCNFFL